VVGGFSFLMQLSGITSISRLDFLNQPGQNNSNAVIVLYKFFLFWKDKSDNSVNIFLWME